MQRGGRAAPAQNGGRRAGCSGAERSGKTVFVFTRGRRTINQTGAAYWGAPCTPAAQLRRSNSGRAERGTSPAGARGLRASMNMLLGAAGRGAGVVCWAGNGPCGRRGAGTWGTAPPPGPAAPCAAVHRGAMGTWAGTRNGGRKGWTLAGGDVRDERQDGGNMVGGGGRLQPAAAAREPPRRGRTAHVEASGARGRGTRHAGGAARCEAGGASSLAPQKA